MRTHGVPTHLHLEDRILAGLTSRQALVLALASAAGYALWQHAPLPPAVRITLTALVALGGLALALARPDGCSLVLWLVLLALYARTPHQAVWQRAGLPLPLDPPVHAGAEGRLRRPGRTGCAAPPPTGAPAA